jgi:poly-gamma-glutamate synthesis protein (capsule biosynthesis protein)
MRTVAVLGDLFPNDRFGETTRHWDVAFADTLAVIADADLRVGSFLMPLSTAGTPMEKLAHIRAAPAIADDLPILQLDLVSLANNHIMDYGVEALTDTCRGLAAAGIDVIGAGDSLTEATRASIRQVGDTTVGIIAFSCLVPPGAAATTARAGISPIRVYSSYQVDAQWAIEEPGEPEMVRIRTWCDEDDTERAVELVRALRAEVDVVLVSLHCGYGSSEDLAEYEQPLVHRLVDAGAGAILGHHVHAVQGVEVYRGAPIVYSCGSFLGRQVPEDASNLTELAERLIAAMSPDGIVVMMHLDAAGVHELEILPTTLNDHGLPLLADGQIFDRVCDRVTRLSTRLGTSLERRDGRLELRV